MEGVNETKGQGQIFLGDMEKSDMGSERAEIEELNKDAKQQSDCESEKVNNEN